MRLQQRKYSIDVWAARAAEQESTSRDSFNHWQFVMTRPFQPYILGICDLTHFMVNKRT